MKTSNFSPAHRFRQSPAHSSQHKKNFVGQSYRRDARIAAIVGCGHDISPRKGLGILRGANAIDDEADVGHENIF